MLDMEAPLIPGNVGNAMSYEFPVRYKVMKGLPADWWCDEIDVYKRQHGSSVNGGMGVKAGLLAQKSNGHLFLCSFVTGFF